MLASWLLAVSMMMISDCENFWDTEKVAAQTQFANVDEQGNTKIYSQQEVEKQIAEMKDKRILVLVHGFDSPDPYFIYTTIVTNMKNWCAECKYDQVIGYVWPCYDSFLDYVAAKGNLDVVMPRLRDILHQIQPTAARVDLLAHSMGNRLALEMLNYTKELSQPNPIYNFFSFAPAVNDDSVDEKGNFALSLTNCNNMYVFHSDYDGILKWLYPLVEWRESLGYEGDIELKKLPANIQMIDCSSVIDEHSAYLNCKPIFTYVDNLEINRAPNPFYAQDVTLSVDEKYTVTRWRHTGFEMVASSP